MVQSGFRYCEVGKQLNVSPTVIGNPLQLPNRIRNVEAVVPEAPRQDVKLFFLRNEIAYPRQFL